jgi:hypothetical protein
LRDDQHAQAEHAELPRQRRRVQIELLGDAVQVVAVVQAVEALDARHHRVRPQHVRGRRTDLGPELRDPRRRERERHAEREQRAHERLAPALGAHALDLAQQDRRSRQPAHQLLGEERARDREPGERSPAATARGLGLQRARVRE